MHIGIGDLVLCRTKGSKVGLVVDSKPPIEGLTCSKHVSHILKTYAHVYYVFFSDIGLSGPYHEAELSLQQSHHTNNSSMEV